MTCGLPVVDRSGSDLLAAVVSAELKEDHDDLARSGDPDRCEHSGQEDPQPPLQRRPDNEHNAYGEHWQHERSGGEHVLCCRISRWPATVPCEDIPNQEVSVFVLYVPRSAGVGPISTTRRSACGAIVKVIREPSIGSTGLGSAFCRQSPSAC
jgi:hypothetical protein